MIKANITELLGFDYEALEDDGSLGIIYTPFLFQDGDRIDVHVDQMDGQLRFFDDGDVIWHFIGLGVPLDEEGDADFIRKLIEPCGARLNEMGEIEVSGSPEQAPATFGRYLSAILEMVRWEREYNAASERRRQQWSEAGASSTGLSASAPSAPSPHAAGTHPACPTPAVAAGTAGTRR
jgi:hypothetical protein